MANPAAITAMTEAISKGAYYVNATAETLKAMIAERHGLTKEHIILSSGSSGVLTNLATMAAQQGSILGSDLFWDTTSRMGTRNSPNGIKRLPKTSDLSGDLDAMYLAVDGSITLAQILQLEQSKRIYRSATETAKFLPKSFSANYGIGGRSLQRGDRRARNQRHDPANKGGQKRRCCSNILKNLWPWLVCVLAT